jgi:MFS family permease
MAVEAERGKGWIPGNTAVALLCGGHGATHFVFAATVMLLPYIRQDAGLSYTEAASLGTAYYVFAFCANFFSGYWVDKLGRVISVQIAAVIVSGGGVMLAGFAGYVLDGLPLYIALVIGWGLSGIGNQAWHPAAFSYLAKHFHERRSFVFSMHVVAANIGDALFPVIAGFLLGHVFVSAAGIEQWEPVAIIGALPCMVVAVLLVVYLLPREREVHASAPQGMSAANYFAGYGALFRNRNAMLLALVAGLRNASQTALLMFLPLYMVDIIKTSPELVGIALMLLQVGGMIAAPIAGHMADRKGERPVVFTCLTLTTIILLGAMTVTDPTLFIVSVGILGFALYAVRPVIQSWMMVLVPDEFRGSATSVMFGVQSACNAAILINGGWIADRFGLERVFVIIAVTILVANFLTFALPKSLGTKASAG